MPSRSTHSNGDNTATSYLQQLLTASQNRDAAIERIASSVQHLATETSRKFDESERDTRKQFDHFATNIANQFQNVTNKFEAALATRDAKLETVSAEFLKSRQAPWAILIAFAMFILSFGGAIGWLAYNPINARTEKIEDAIEKMTDTQGMMREFLVTNFVTHKDLDARTERGREDRERTNRVIEQIQQNTFAKEVHQTRWTSFETQLSSMTLRMDTQVENLQREIDMIQKSLGDTYTARDALLDNRKRIEDLEARIRELATMRGTGGFGR